MRLLNVHSFDFQEFDSATIPKYAIASHRWYEGDEASLKDIFKRRNIEKRGYQKILGFAEYVRNNLPGIDWLWTDTCCINQESSQEVSTSVNSMFKWYRNAEICIAYLVDVTSINDTHEFSQSIWFKRGWTLQELVAPHLVVFLSRDWKLLGHKGGNGASEFETKLQLGPSLEPTIANITGIPESVLHDYESSKGLSPEAKMQWTVGRQTTVEEDMSYCLLGFFEVTMVTIYGEGGAKAKERLRKKISKATNGFDTGRDSPEIQSSQIFTVPFLRDPDFIDRLELRELESKVLSNRRRVAVVGLGGVGKSQLAIECCYRLQDKSSGIRILWIHASNAARFDEGIQKLADDVGLPGRQESKADVFQLVHNWLCERNEGRWCLVLDSVDDAEFLFQPRHGQSEGRRARIEYLSVCPLGTVVITTRSREVASSFTDEQDILPVHPMDQGHAVALMEKKLGAQNDAKAVGELTAALDYMPLAIAQAAAYIKRRAPRCSLEQYLATYRKSDESKIKLLNAHSKELRRDREATNAILLTWQISFEHIYESRRSAANMLSLMSFFDHQSIPERLLRYDGCSAFREERDSELNNGDYDKDAGDRLDDSFENDITTLRDYSFISVLPDGSTFKMHRLVQLAARNWLISHDQHHQWAKQSSHNLDLVFPEFDDDRRTNLEPCRLFYPHARLVRNPALDDKDAALRCASVLYKAACFALDQGSYSDGADFACRSLKWRRKVLEDNDSETLRSEMMLANALNLQGHFEAAEQLLRKVIDGRTEVFGPENPATLGSVSILAVVLSNREQHDAAEKLGRQVVDGSEKVLGKEHPDTFRSMRKLAAILQRQGKYEAAEEMGRSAIKGLEMTLGEESVEALWSSTELACLLLQRGKIDAAEEMYVRSLRGHEKLLGKEHPATLTTSTMMGNLLRLRERHEEAEALLRPAIQTMGKVLGNEHPNTLSALLNLGLAVQNQGKFEGAQEMFHQLVEGLEKRYGKEHPTTLTCLGLLGWVILAQEKCEAAKEVFQRALEGGKEGLGLEQPHTLISIWGLALLHWMRHEHDEAVILYERAHSGLTKLHGPSHPHTVECLEQLTALRREVDVRKLGSATEGLSLGTEIQKEVSVA